MNTTIKTANTYIKKLIIATALIQVLIPIYTICAAEAFFATAYKAAFGPRKKITAKKADNLYTNSLLARTHQESVAIIKKALKKIDINAIITDIQPNQTLLVYAITKYLNLTMAKVLITLNADVNAYAHKHKDHTQSGQTPLTAAIQIQSAEIINMLLERGANIHGQNLLYHAMIRNKYHQPQHIAQLLLMLGTDVNEYNHHTLCPHDHLPLSCPLDQALSQESLYDDDAGTYIKLTETQELIAILILAGAEPQKPQAYSILMQAAAKIKIDFQAIDRALPELASHGLIPDICAIIAQYAHPTTSYQSIDDGRVKLSPYDRETKNILNQAIAFEMKRRHYQKTVTDRTKIAFKDSELTREEINQAISLIYDQKPESA